MPIPLTAVKLVCLSQEVQCQKALRAPVVTSCDISEKFGFFNVLHNHVWLFLRKEEDERGKKIEAKRETKNFELLKIKAFIR